MVLPSLVEIAAAISLELVRCTSLLPGIASVPFADASQLTGQMFKRVAGLRADRRSIASRFLSLEKHASGSKQSCPGLR